MDHERGRGDVQQSAGSGRLGDDGHASELAE
jgi:hypothetical protein